jgi:hypothetical protein
VGALRVFPIVWRVRDSERIRPRRVHAEVDGGRRERLERRRRKQYRDIERRGVEYHDDLGDNYMDNERGGNVAGELRHDVVARNQHYGEL